MSAASVEALSGIDSCRATARGAPVEASLRATVLRYCLARLGQRDVAEDVTQDVFLTLLTAGRLTPVPLDGGDSLVPYAIGIARHKIADLGRTGRLLVPLDGVDEPVDMRAGPEDETVHRDELCRLQRLVARLPTEHAELLLMRMSGVGLPHAAQALGMTVAAARACQTRALNRLRDLASVDGLTAGTSS